MTRSQRIKKQLGVSQGAACHKLRKMLLFSMAQELGRDTCHVCSKLIESVDEFSIEHIKPWEGRDTALFWDLSNIAFSHRACNMPHKRVGPKARVIVNEGHAWCRHHECEHPIEEFSIHNDRGKLRTRSDCKRARVERHQKGLSA